MAVLETDVVVVGTGSVGSMAAWQAAARGLRVVGIDRFSIPGPFSGYGGESRLFRKVYVEGGHYAPLLDRAEALWRELEERSGASLLHTAGGAVTIYDEHNPALGPLLAAGEAHGYPHELLRGDEARARYPEHVIRDGDVTVFDPAGGYLSSEKAVVAALAEAERLGAEFLGDRKALAVEPHGDRWLVRTDRDEVVADRVILSPGTGAGALLSSLGIRLGIRPQVLTWFPVREPGAFAREDQPVFMRRSEEEGRADRARFYGFPSADGFTVKVAGSVYMDEVPSMERPIAWDPRHIDPVRSWVREFLPSLVPDPVRIAVCADGYTEDGDGVVGAVPGMPGVVVAAGFSGHGFKMASSLGAVATELAVDGTTATDVSFLDPARFGDVEPRGSLALD